MKTLTVLSSNDSMHDIQNSNDVTDSDILYVSYSIVRAMASISLLPSSPPSQTTF